MKAHHPHHRTAADRAGKRSPPGNRAVRRREGDRLIFPGNRLGGPLTRIESNDASAGKITQSPGCERFHHVDRASCAGVSLTEMLVVMSVASVIIGLSGMMIHRLLAAEHEATRMARFGASVTRLSRAFRDDIHAAREIELPAGDDLSSGPMTAKFSDDHVARYEIDAHLVTRVETEAGSQVHRDTFHFPPGSQLRFERAADGKLMTIEMKLADGRRSSSPAMGRTLRIEALLARDKRFEGSRREEGRSP